jgi:hypothetical protein
MAQMDLKLLDAVALTVDLPASGLSRGNVGTVVGVLDAECLSGGVLDSEGATYGLETLKSSQLIPLLHRKLSA